MSSTMMVETLARMPFFFHLTKATAVSLLEALKTVTEADLTEVNEKIAAMESELNDFKQLQKVIEIKLGMRRSMFQTPGANRGGRPRKRPETPADGSAEISPASQYTTAERHRMRVREYIMANGPASQATICKQCDIPHGSITAVLKHDWFTFTARGVELTRSLNPNPS